MRCLSSLIIAFFLVFSSHAAEKSEFDAAKKIQEILNLYLEQKEIAGAAVGILKDGQLQFFTVGTTGLGQNRPPTEKTVYEIGSITKVFTTLLAIKLELKGLLKMQDPLSNYWPELKGHAVGDVTLLELATHTSGLPRLTNNFRPRDRLDPYADYSEAKALEYLLSLQRHSHPVPFSWKNYSNFAFGLLGMVLEKASGKSFETLLKNEILIPLGMENTFVVADERQTQLFAQPLSDFLEPVKFWNFSHLHGLGAIKSTTEDLLKFAKAQLEPDETELGQAIKASQKIQYEVNGEAIALSWNIFRANGSIGYAHSGGTGGFRSNLMFLPETKTAIVLLNNSENEIQCAARILFLNSDCTPNFGFKYTEQALSKMSGVYESKKPAIKFVFYNYQKYLVYEIPGQEKGKLFSHAENNFQILEVGATFEFIPSANGAEFPKLKFSQGPFSIEMDRAK